MWKYIILNAFWFSILGLVHFFGHRRDIRIVSALMLLTFAYLAFFSMIDPFVWLCYLVFSILVFDGAGRFRQWTRAKVKRADEVLKDLALAFKVKNETLTARTDEADVASLKATEIMRLYDEVKEMSKSLDLFETFLIFGESLAGNYRFESMKFAVFADEGKASSNPLEFYEMNFSRFQGILDRSLISKERKSVKTKVFPFDQKVFRRIFRERRSLEVSEESGQDFYEAEEAKPKPFLAFPVLIHDRIFAIVTVIGLVAKETSLLNILVGRFMSEAQRVKLYQQIERLAVTDGLTSVYVRRHLLERLQEELERSKRFTLKLSFLMIDVDYFKRFNDEYGHLVGDVILKEVAKTIKKSIREIDLVGRYGGEEFGVLLVETDEPGALLVAERIRRSVESKEFKAYDETLKVTISIGSCTYAQNFTDLNLIVEAADSALYQAKRQGRNRVNLYTVQGTT